MRLERVVKAFIGSNVLVDKESEETGYWVGFLVIII